MAILKPIVLATLALAAQSTAQSANPGLGANPKAQGSTEEVTQTTGPNG
jgi:hypothetical protein